MGILRFWRPLLFILLIIGAAVTYRYTGLKDHLSAQGFAHLKAEALALGWRGEAILFGIYVLFVSLGLPNLPFQLAAGALYGTIHAFLLMYAGVNLGALCAFLFARTLGRRAVEELWGHRLNAINHRIEKGGFRFLLILRLIPLMPFNAINYGSGISRLKIKDYIFANLLGTLPLTFLHVAFGSAAGNLDLTNPRSWTDPRLSLPIIGLVLMLYIAIRTSRPSRTTK